MTANELAFHNWQDGLDWGEETLSEQRERLVKLCLSPESLARRERMESNSIYTKIVVQLTLFDGECVY